MAPTSRLSCMDARQVWRVEIEPRHRRRKPSAISIRHHMYPFKREVPASGQSFDKQALQKAGLDYLTALSDLVALP